MLDNSQPLTTRRRFLALAGAPILGLADADVVASTQAGPALTVIPAVLSAHALAGSPCLLTSASVVTTGDDSLDAVADWLVNSISRFAGIGLTRKHENDFPIFLNLDPGLASGSSTLGVRADGKHTGTERYTLAIDTDAIRISGTSPEGVFRGATTLVHLIAQAADDGQSWLDPILIEDSPRFAWRGLSLDVVRTFHPVDTVKTVMEVLALYKMNVLHLHLTDAEGWRFEVPSYPNLTAISGQTARDGRPGGFYTQEEYADILAYAAKHFVTVVPEFDSPGHTASALRAYPELGTLEMHSAPAAMQFLDPANPATWDFVRAVFEEMARVHPGQWIHAGGDEAIAMSDAAFRDYMESALSIVRSTGKGVIAWQEATLAGFAPGDLVQWWISPQLIQNVQEASENPHGGFMASLPDAEREAFFALFLGAPAHMPAAIDQGAHVIVSRADLVYLDTKYPEPSTDPDQEAHRQRVGLPPAVYGNGSVRTAYEWDPALLDPDITLDRIAGIEAAIWCETILDRHDLMTQLLPRLPGVAEKAWSESRDWADYHPRLAAQARLWDAIGVPYFRSSVVWVEGESHSPATGAT